MCVITISRGSFIGGKLFAECLAKNLGYRCIDREVIVERAAVGGVKRDELREALLRPPSLFDRLITHKKFLYLTLLQAALAEEVRDGKVVYHGYAGHLLLGGAGPIFRIRVIASPEFRLKMAQEHLELSREEAVAYVEKVDRERKRWTQLLYGVDWEDSSLYDMVLNLGYVYNLEEACEIVSAMVRAHKCFEFTPERQAALHDFALASRVRAALTTNTSTANVHAEVLARSGSVSIAAKVDDAEQLQEVERVAREIPGVTGVELRY